MQATLTFNLPEERVEHHLALRGQDYHAVLCAWREEMVERINHPECFSGEAPDAATLERMIELLNAELDGRTLSLDVT